MHHHHHHHHSGNSPGYSEHTVSTSDWQHSRQGSRQQPYPSPREQQHSPPQHQQQHAGPPQWPPAVDQCSSSHQRPSSVSQHQHTTQGACIDSRQKAPHARSSGPGGLCMPSPAAAPLSASSAQHASSSMFNTPREHSSRGPRSYALALAGSCKPPAPQHSQQADWRNMHPISRPATTAAGHGSRPGTAGYGGRQTVQSSAIGCRNSSSSSRGIMSGYTPRGSYHHQQQQPHHQQGVPMQQQRQQPQPQAPPAPTYGAAKGSGHSQHDALASFRRPGSAAAVRHSTPWQGSGPEPQPSGCRPHTVAAGTQLLLADCFRPSTAAGPASISGVEGQQYGSRPHTAAAAVARWWDAGAAGLSCSFQEGAEGADGGAEAQRQWQQQQLWCAAHEIDGRPATRNGMRSR